MTLWADFLAHQGRPIHKWRHYFPAYERHFGRFQNRAVVMLEIGCGDGGSLQLWRQFLGPLARIVGIDVNPTCKGFAEDQIDVRIGDQADSDFLDSVVREFARSRSSLTMVATSCATSSSRSRIYNYHPGMDPSGVYVVEDLHVAYWPECGGGHLGEGNFIEVAKRHVDELNAYHTRGAVAASPFTDTTLSIHFYDSLVVYERGRHVLNSPIVSGAIQAR